MPPGDRTDSPVTQEQAESLARELYGLTAAARALPGERDDNFHLTTGDGPGWVLKVMHPGRERALIELQCRVLAHLARALPDVTLPRVRVTESGEALAETSGGGGARRVVYMLAFVPGVLLADARPHTPALLASLGRMLGRIDAALFGFDASSAARDNRWDLAQAAWIRGELDHIDDQRQRNMARRCLERFEAEVVAALPRLRRSPIHGDANDYNVLVGDPRSDPREVRSVIDFGDLLETITVAEVAIAAAYALLGKADPLAAAAHVIAGYHAACPLDAGEIALLFTLIRTRLAVSVTTSALRKRSTPDDAYVTISEAPAWRALEQLDRIHPRFAHATFRAACGLSPLSDGAAVTDWIRSSDPAPVLEGSCDDSLVLDLGVSSLLLGANPQNAECEALSATIAGAMRRSGATVGVGRYDEVRLLYTSQLFDGGSEERRTIHLGIDLFAPPGTAVHAPLDGAVHVLAHNDADLDYGPLVILRHATDAGRAFFTLYGHLGREVLADLHIGQAVRRGEVFCRVGAPPGNGGWPPHVHVQIILDLLDQGGDFPGVAKASERAVWTSLSPDPNLLLRIPAARFPARPPNRTATLAARRVHLGPNLSISYREPLQAVRGWMQHLYDENGRPHLDLYNNVPLVGHSHPRVVAAAQAQLGLLNTNTRYPHDLANRYAERLLAKLPEPLRVCFFLSSGSEANELALRLARAHTEREDVVVLEHAYHGNTTTLIDVSPYKFDGPGGVGRKPWVHVAPLPDDYRGRYRRGDPDAGGRYAAHVGAIAQRLAAQGSGVAAFLAETLPSVAGQIVLPDGYLASAYRHVRAAGGVCIADEVQVGFGRLGTHFWGFETQGVVPDVVVLGKPIGNGFPLAAVVTTREVAASFANGMEFFSTFGGNPVACAAGLAVLDVLETEALQERARQVGARLIQQLREMADRHEVIGDVRGSGLFLGIELVRDRATREPAAQAAACVVERLRERGVLTGTDGPHHNVLKLRPPLVLSERDADGFVALLDDVLGEDAICAWASTGG